MVAMMGSKKFDPAEHLTKQGWKGKGTALKSGHLTRPLAVIQKKTLSGVGKDRDEAVPFWDQIFAATAASLSLPSTTTTTPGSTTPTLILPRLIDPRSNKNGSWQTSGSSTNQPPKPQSGLNITVRIARDNARRGLYSRFFRGEDVREVDLEESEAVVEIMEGEAGPSRIMDSTPDVEGMSGKEEVKESKEEKRIRRAEKARRRKERAERKALKMDKKEEAVGTDDKEGKVEKRKRKSKELKAIGEEVVVVGEGEAEKEEKKDKKKRRRKDEAIARETVL